MSPTACLTVRVLSGSQWNLQSLDCCLLSWLEYRDRLHKTFTLNALLSRILNYPSKIACPLRVMLLTTYQTLPVVRFCGIHTSSVNLRSIYHLKDTSVLKCPIYLCFHAYNTPIYTDLPSLLSYTLFHWRLGKPFIGMPIPYFKHL